MDDEYEDPDEEDEGENQDEDEDEDEGGDESESGSEARRVLRTRDLFFFKSTYLYPARRKASGG